MDLDLYYRFFEMEVFNDFFNFLVAASDSKSGHRHPAGLQKFFGLIFV
jgi:hypothetical protein